MAQKTPGPGFSSELPPRPHRQEESEREGLNADIAATEDQIRYMQNIVPSIALLGMEAYDRAVSHNHRIVLELQTRLEELKRRRDEIDGKTRQESEVEQATPSVEEQTSEAGGEATTQEKADALEAQLSLEEDGKIGEVQRTLDELYNDSDTGDGSTS